MLGYLCNWHSTFIYIKGLNPAIGLHCRQTCMALLIWALPAVASLSVQYPVKSAHISTVAEDAIKCTSKTRLCLHNVPVCTCSNTWWPTPGGNCVFSILAHCSLPDSITLFLLIIRPLCFDKSLPSTSFVASPCGLKPHRHSLCSSTCRPFVFHRSSEQMWLLCGSAFVRCQSQHPEAMFSSWSPFLWPSLVCFFCSLAFGTLYPAYSSYKAVKTKNVKEYVSITPGY